jgi:RNA polymerase sigma-70 factor (sigma-E family)
VECWWNAFPGQAGDADLFGREENRSPAVTSIAEASVQPPMSDALIAEPAEVAPAFEAFDEALVALYRQHAKPLVEMLSVFVGDRAEAEDLCQEAFIRLHRAWRRMDRAGNVAGYLRATAFNLARSGFRRRAVARRRQPAPAPEGSAPADEGVELRADQVDLLAAVRRLSPRQRECIVLRYWEDQTDAAIATTLGISPNSVKTHLRRAMDALEQELEKK